MTAEQRAAITARAIRSRVEQGLPPDLPPVVVERVRAVLTAARAGQRARAPPARDDPIMLRARRQAVLGDLVDVDAAADGP